MTISKLHNGALSISTIANGYLVTRTYYGYSRREAVSMFREYLKSL